MANISTITTFLGWCTVLNFGLYIFSALIIAVFNAPIKKLHAKITNIPAKKLDVLYFNFLSHYKLAIFITNLVPYIALKVMVS